MIQTVFAEADWYRARDEPEVRREGVLAPHRHATGPRTRGGCDVVLRGADGDELVYSAGVERVLSRVAGRRVTVVGKVVVVDGRSELWIGRLSTT